MPYHQAKTKQFQKLVKTCNMSVCKKCEWHHKRAGYSYNWTTGNETHNIEIDVCIHPVLDDLKKTNSNGEKQYHVEKCEVRNDSNYCKYFQPQRSLIIKIIDLFRGRKWLDIYEKYNNIKSHSAYAFYKEL